jgi:long-chain acyl-CoA synthetase
MRNSPSLCQALRRAVALRAAGIAVIDGEKSFTWSQFEDRVARLAGAFASFAALRAGWVITPLNHRLAAGELRVQVADCAPDIIILGDDFTHFASEFLDAAKGGATLLHTGDRPAPEGLLSLERLLTDAASMPTGGAGAMILHAFLTQAARPASRRGAC